VILVLARYRLFALALVLALVLAAACGDDVAPTDGGLPDAPTVDAGMTVAAPDIPWLEAGGPPPRDCPAGWRAFEEGGVAACDPYPAEGPASCGGGEAHYLGESGCHVVGDPCPPGEFAADLPTGGSVIFVDDSAAAGGDGSSAMPFGGLEDVRWTSLTTGTTVALAKGSYTGALIETGLGVARVSGAVAADGPYAFVSILPAAEESAHQTILLACP